MRKIERAFAIVSLLIGIESYSAWTDEQALLSDEMKKTAATEQTQEQAIEEIQAGSAPETEVDKKSSGSIEETIEVEETTTDIEETITTEEITESEAKEKIQSETTTGEGSTETTEEPDNKKNTREVVASCYGPGFFGNRTASGILLTRQTLGIAHKTWGFVKKVNIAFKDKCVDVPVIDRGPFVHAREIDITEATAKELGFKNCYDFGVRKVQIADLI